MNKSQSVVLIIIALLVVGLLVYFAATEPAYVGPDGEEAEAEAEAPAGQELVPGGSLVDEEGRVLTSEGEEVDQAAEPGSETAPQQSSPISEDEAPKDAVKLRISAAGYEPSSFEVDSGSTVTLSVTSADSSTHIFKFRNPELQGVALGLAPGETRAITFKAPADGEYEFFCDVPGHDGRGENGVMTVN